LLKHVNAYEIFSPEMVEEIQKYYSVGYLWIPKIVQNKRRVRCPRR
jgi:hypothetical protein